MSSSFEGEPQISATRTDVLKETTSNSPAGVSKPQILVTKTDVSTTTIDVSGADSETEAQAIAEEISEDITKIGRSALKSLTGFRTFILRGNVIDLAIGIVIGAAFTSVVTSLVSDVITPLIPLPGKNSLGLLTIPLPGFYPTGSVIHIGLFINAIISFLIVAAVLYFFVVQPVNSLMNIYKPKTDEKPTLRECPHCFQEVNIKATRCPYCTSHLFKDGTPIHHEDEGAGLMLPAELEKLSDKLAEKITAKAKAATLASEEEPPVEGEPEK